MSLRPAPWPIFGSGNAARRAASDSDARERRSPRQSRPELKLVKGEGAPRLERLTPRARLTALVVMVGVVLFAVVAFHVLLSQGQFRLEQMQTRADKEQAQYERMRLQVAQLESPARITSEAQQRLGMVPPDKVTPVAPSGADMPKGTATPAGPATPSATPDPGAWTSVKPHLNSATK